MENTGEFGQFAHGCFLEIDKKKWYDCLHRRKNGL